MTELTFNNKKGQPIGYAEDGVHSYLFNGKAVSYLTDNSVYSYTGKYLGYYHDGWIRDRRGNCVFFTEILIIIWRLKIFEEISFEIF